MVDSSLCHDLIDATCEVNLMKSLSFALLGNKPIIKIVAGSNDGDLRSHFVLAVQVVVDH